MNNTLSKEHIIKNINHNYNGIVLMTLFDKCISTIFSITVINGFHYLLTINEIIFASISSGFTEILPINSFGNFGTLELGWAGALIYSGVSSEIAIESGFSFHFVAFSITILFGLISIIPCFFIFRHRFVNVKS